MKWWALEHPDLVKYKVVELAVDATADLDDESIRAITTLEHHPGFKALMAKFKLQRGLLEAKLKGGKFKDLREIDNIQNGLYWAGWLERTVAAEVFKQENAPRKARDAYELSDKLLTRARDLYAHGAIAEAAGAIVQ